MGFTRAAGSAILIPRTEQENPMAVVFNSSTHPDAWWRGVASQFRDTVDNDNRTAAEEVEHARAMVRWAESRAGDPGFAAFCQEAVRQAQETFRQHRPRSV
jgi:hypothetical protein